MDTQMLGVVVRMMKFTYLLENPIMDVHTVPVVPKRDQIGMGRSVFPKINWVQKTPSVFSEGVFAGRFLKVLFG
jgi:hypothetical protein